MKFLKRQSYELVWHILYYIWHVFFFFFLNSEACLIFFFFYYLKKKKKCLSYKSSGAANMLLEKNSINAVTEAVPFQTELVLKVLNVHLKGIYYALFLMSSETVFGVY